MKVGKVLFSIHPVLPREGYNDLVCTTIALMLRDSVANCTKYKDENGI